MPIGILKSVLSGQVQWLTKRQTLVNKVPNAWSLGNWDAATIDSLGR